MTQRLGKFGLISFVVGILALLAWGEYEQGWMLTAALLSGGTGLVSGALEIVLTQRGQTLEGVGRWYRQWGFALYPWAFVFLFFGGMLVAFGAARLLGLEASLSSYLTRRPGSVLIAAGLVMAGSGAATVIGPRSWSESGWDLLLRLPSRFAGLLLAVMGIAALFLGLFEAIHPSGFDQWLEATLGPFNPLLE